MPSPASPRPWRHDFHACSSAPAIFGNFAPLVALWQQQRGKRALPAWKDFDFEAFAGWHDMMVLDAIDHDPFDALTLIWGSRLAEIAGYQPRGKRLSESIAMRGLLEEDFAFFRRVVNESCIGVATGQLDWRGRNFITLSRLYMPCAPVNGVVDHVVSFCEIVAAPS